MNVFCLGANEIDELWPLYGHHLERLEREGGLLVASAIREDLKAERRQLWGYQAPEIIIVAVTELYQSPKGLMCLIQAGCGTETQKGQIEQIIFEIERWAKSQGCTRIRLGGRYGWKRRLKDFSEVGIILEKEI